MQQGSALLSLDETTPQMLREAITDARAWKRETLSPDTGWCHSLRRALLNWMPSCSFTAIPTACSASDAGGV